MSETPYPGLRPFQRGETDIFFGREALIDELVDRLARTRILCVVGPSGCGKSSLVRAGLLDALESGFMASAGAGWKIADMRPGGRPMLRLAEALMAVSDRPRYDHDSAFLQAALERGPLSLIEYLHDLPLHKNDNLLILVDQFEEIFRFDPGTGQEEADTFVALLLAAAGQREQPIYVVITMRSDFIGDCARFPGLPEAVNEAQFLTPRLTREQSRQAIEGPARVFGGSIEPALVNRLLNDMGTDPDQLPLMQHALMRMWSRAGEESEDHESGTRLPSPGDRSAETPAPITLSLEGYEKIGGLAEALSNHADEAFAELEDGQQAIAEKLFRCLSERGPERRDTRRPVSLDEVAKVAGVSHKQTEAVVDVFRRSDRCFLTPSATVPLVPETILDISHESLIRQWRRLSQWVEREALSAETYSRLEQTARLWEKKKAALWGTPDLENALAWREREKPTASWAKRYSPHFKLAMKFLNASETEHEAEHLRKEEARKQELLAAEKERTARRLGRLSIALAIVALLAIVAGIFAWNQRQLAASRAAEAEEATAKAVVPLEETKQAKAETDEALKKAEQERKRAEGALEQIKEEKKKTDKALEVAQQERQRAKDALEETKQAKAETDEALQKAEQERQRTEEALEQIKEEKTKTEEALKVAQKERKRAEDALEEARIAQMEEKAARDAVAPIVQSLKVPEPEMVEVPAGSFMMGSPESDSSAQSDEFPPHPVKISKPFAIGKYEVTFEEYDTFALATGRALPNDGGWGRGKRPVINVTWNDVVAYAEWLSQQTGKRYRLPSEAEWEYAAQAGTKTSYWWGDEIGTDRANCDGCGSRWDKKQTAPVGSFKANPFGLYDTAGNVWEWVQDCWNECYEGAPEDGSAWKSGDCGRRVFRGGSWFTYPGGLRSANRGWHTADPRDYDIGFRLAQDL